MIHYNLYSMNNLQIQQFLQLFQKKVLHALNKVCRKISMNQVNVLFNNTSHLIINWYNGQLYFAVWTEIIMKLS